MRRWTALLIAAVLASALATVHADDGGVRVTRVREYVAHTRLGNGGATLTAGGLQLVVAPGAAPAGAVVGLGAGGVADTDGALAGTGVVVTASTAGVLTAVVVFTPDDLDRALVAGRVPSLLDVARGTLIPCLERDSRAACPVTVPGAYVVRGGDVRVGPEDGPMLAAAFDGVPSSGSSGNSPWRRLLLALAAACAAAAVVLHRR